MDINSTSFPCYAVIKHFNVRPEAEELVYRLGRAMREDVSGRARISEELATEAILVLGNSVCGQLFLNYARAAEQFGWR